MHIFYGNNCSCSYHEHWKSQGPSDTRTEPRMHKCTNAKQRERRVPSRIVYSEISFSCWFLEPNFCCVSLLVFPLEIANKGAIIAKSICKNEEYEIYLKSIRSTQNIKHIHYIIKEYSFTRLMWSITLSTRRFPRIRISP